ncbi:MAG TPA: sialate O-acetylesterase [Verrucomicrobiae bacterium]|nr:sialate O-acetylesterase [Verrucomicrobiae bacterium]
MKIKSKLSLLLVLFLSLTRAHSQDTNFWIFLCFGQSNMESGGRMDAQDRTVDPRFQVMADADSARRGWEKGHWYDAVPPLSARGTGICMVDYFGRTMVSNLPPNIRIGIIKVAVPGCKIELFQKDIYTNYVATVQPWMLNYIKGYDGNPYQCLVDMGKLAQKDGVIKGILLHQGESNPNDLEWPNKVKGIYDDLIKDLHLNPKEVPLLSGELVNVDEGGVCAAFNKIMARLPETLPNSYVISSAGCPCNPDHMHFNSAGSRKFGERYGDKMLEVMGYPVKPAAAPPEIQPGK